MANWGIRGRLASMKIGSRAAKNTTALGLASCMAVPWIHTRQPERRSS
jgi:hypothetical protein